MEEITKKSSTLHEGKFKLGLIIIKMEKEEQNLFKKIVESIKFGDSHSSLILANELAKIRILRKKLSLFKQQIQYIEDKTHKNYYELKN